MDRYTDMGEGLVFFYMNILLTPKTTGGKDYQTIVLPFNYADTVKIK